MGYHRAGFEVYGVDIDPQPNYPFWFHQGDVLEVLAVLLAGGSVEFTHPDGRTKRMALVEFAAAHMSPPCQAFSRSASLHTNEHPDLLDPTRELLEATGLPWIIENVPGAPLRSPLTLCGSEFELQAPDLDGVLVALRRHRLFESNVPLMSPGGCRHDPTMPTASLYGEGGANTLAYRDNPDRAKGYIPALSVWVALLGIDWMTKREMAQVIPPAYTEFLGDQLRRWVA